MGMALPRMVDRDAGMGGYLDKADIIEARIDFLDGKEKAIMQMRFRQGASFAQIAAMLDMHEASAARQVNKLTRRLLKGSFALCIKNRRLLNDAQLAVARDKYLLRMSLDKIAKKQNCTRYRIRRILAELSARINSARQ